MYCVLQAFSSEAARNVCADAGGVNGMTQSVLLLSRLERNGFSSPVRHYVWTMMPYRSYMGYGFSKT
jgi:hypothetical protein